MVGAFNLFTFKVIIDTYDPIRASLIAQLVKNLPAMQQTWVRFLGREDPLEKETVTHSSIVVWRIPWTEEPGRLYSPWSCKSQTRLSNYRDTPKPSIKGL